MGRIGLVTKYIVDPSFAAGILFGPRHMPYIREYTPNIRQGSIPVTPPGISPNLTVDVTVTAVGCPTWDVPPTIFAAVIRLNDYSFQPFGAREF